MTSQPNAFIPRMLASTIATVWAATQVLHMWQPDFTLPWEVSGLMLGLVGSFLGISILQRRA